MKIKFYKVNYYIHSIDGGKFTNPNRCIVLEFPCIYNPKMCFDEALIKLKSVDYNFDITDFIQLN